jgi:hypothetical protein
VQCTPTFSVTHVDVTIRREGGEGIGEERGEKRGVGERERVIG